MATTELLRVLARIVEAPSAGQPEIARALHLGTPADEVAHTGLFQLQLPPYASIHLGEEGMLGGEARDRIAGFFRALDVPPPSDPDHLTVLLASLAELTDREDAAQGADERASWRRSRAALFWEHVASWLPAYLTAVQRVADPFHRRWAQLLLDVLADEARTLGAPSATPMAFQSVGGLEDPREAGADAFVGSVLTSLRLGAVTTRVDLARAARDLGLGLRVGERRFVFRSLLDQDPAAVLRWLAEFVNEQPSYPAELAAVGDHWRRRSEQSAALLEELAVEAERAISAVG